MKLFSRLYDMALVWAAHRHAPRYLAALTFAESSFFPVPPDVMLAPMVLAKRQQAWRLAALTTASSVLGGMTGYLIGWLAFGAIEPALIQLGYAEDLQATRAWFDEWGVWVVFLAGFSPIPYKIFTIGAGAASLAFLPFVAASLVGRAGRFYLVAGLVYLGGENMAEKLRQYVDVIGWATVVLLAIAYVIWG